MSKLFLLLVIVSPLLLQAQNVATTSLRWTCNQTTDLRTGNTTTYSCAFITNGAGTVSWLQRGGQMATRYTITSTEGSWNDVSTNGSFTYLLSRDGKSGRLVVRRSGDELTLTLDFSESGEFNVKQQFRVSEVAVQP